MHSFEVSLGYESVDRTTFSTWSGFIGMWNISFIIMWPLHKQSYCNISMKNGSNVIIRNLNRGIIKFCCLYNYKNWMHSFEVSLGYESVERTTFSTWSAVASLEMYFGQRFHTPNETSKECIQFLIILCDYQSVAYYIIVCRQFKVGIKIMKVVTLCIMNYKILQQLLLI
jgi:hypothetical protein